MKLNNSQDYLFIIKGVGKSNIKLVQTLISELKIG